MHRPKADSGYTGRHAKKSTEVRDCSNGSHWHPARTRLYMSDSDIHDEVKVQYSADESPLNNELLQYFLPS